MVELDRKFQWNEKENTLTIKTVMDEELSEAQVVGIYENLLEGLKQLEIQKEKMTKDEVELRPFYEKFRKPK